MTIQEETKLKSELVQLLTKDNNTHDDSIYFKRLLVVLNETARLLNDFKDDFVD